MILFSTVAGSNTGVLAGTGGVVLISCLLSFFPRLKRIMPTLLTDRTSLIYGLAETKIYTVPLIIAAVTIPVCLAVSVSSSTENNCDGDVGYFKKSISAVALFLGFSSQGHFSKVFKELTGMTPGEYRKKKQT